MNGILCFLLKFTLMNVVGAGILYFCLKRLNADRERAPVELLAYSLGAAPALFSLLLYYAFLCFPRQTDAFYLAFVGAGPALLLWLGRKEAAAGIKAVLSPLGRIASHIKKGGLKISPPVPPRRLEQGAHSLIVLLILVYLGISFPAVLRRPVAGHDALTYAAQGKAMYRTRQVEFREMLLDPETGAYQASFHAPSFSLLLTWEKMVNRLCRRPNDLYFRSLGFYYGLLILGLLFFWLRRKNRWLALLGLTGLLFSPFFHLSLFRLHIDTFRIFFLLVSWIELARAVKKTDRVTLLLLGTACGFSAYAHIIGAVISLFTLSAYAVFSEGGFRTRVKHLSWTALAALTAGGIHYVLDILVGKGWIVHIRV